MAPHMGHTLANPSIQQSFQREYRRLLTQLRIQPGQRVLDIGSGVGFLKPMVHQLGAQYAGIEPSDDAYAAACSLYGEEGFVCGYFPQDLHAGKFDHILVLSCVDEVPERGPFLVGLRERLVPGRGTAYIAVRNKAFFINWFKNDWTMARSSARARISLQDLTDAQWQSLLRDSGLEIVEQGKFLRPWFTGWSAAGMKNVLYRLFSHLLPRRCSYMLYYRVKAG